VAAVHLKTFRFAPTPNGYLHRGHALSALLNARAAQKMDGRFLVRIEDYDTSRASPTYEAAIFEDLAWLGLSWAEAVLRQRDRLDAYRAALDSLQKLGLIYPAFLSRSEIAARVADASRRPAWPRDRDGRRSTPAERGGPEARCNARSTGAGPTPAPPHGPRAGGLATDMARITACRPRAGPAMCARPEAWAT
jgi:glutamyl-Q tRNA(Asp) synthetase